MRRIGQIVSKERVQQALAGPEQDITPNAVEVHVSRLARQARRCRGDPEPARPRLPAGRSEDRVSSSHQPPVGAVAGGPADAAGACAERWCTTSTTSHPASSPATSGCKRGVERPHGAHRGRTTARVTLDAAADGKPPLPAADSIDYSRCATRRAGCCSAMRKSPPYRSRDASDQVFALAQLDARSVRTLTTRFDTPAGRAHVVDGGRACRRTSRRRASVS